MDKEDRYCVKKLILRLFPRLESVWGNANYGSDWKRDWRKQRRICISDVFPVYFRLAVPQGSVSFTEIRAFLEASGDARFVAQFLMELGAQRRPGGPTRARVFLGRLTDYLHDELPQENIQPLVEALFQIGDRLAEDEGELAGTFEFGMGTDIVSIAHRLITRLKSDDRIELLLRTTAECDAVSTIVRSTVFLAQEHGEHGGKPIPEHERIVTNDQLAELEVKTLQRIRHQASVGKLLKTPYLSFVLKYWTECACADEVQVWVAKTTEGDESLAQFLEAFLRPVFTHSLGDRTPRRHYRLDPEWLAPYVEAATVFERVQRLVDEPWLSELQRVAAAQFAREYLIRQQGQDPEYVLFHDEE